MRVPARSANPYRIPSKESTPLSLGDGRVETKLTIRIILVLEVKQLLPTPLLVSVYLLLCLRPKGIVDVCVHLLSAGGLVDDLTEVLA